MTCRGGDHDIYANDVTGNIYMELGYEAPGEDRVQIFDTEQGDQTFFTFGGNDNVTVSRVPDNSLLLIDVGNGNNLVKVDGLLAADADITSGTGDDVITLNENTDASIGQIVPWQNTKAYSINVNTNEGDDEVFIETSPMMCKMSITTGSGADTIGINGLGYGSEVTVFGGSGNDILQIDGREDEMLSDLSQAINTMVCEYLLK